MVSSGMFYIIVLFLLDFNCIGVSLRNIKVRVSSMHDLRILLVYEIEDTNYMFESSIKLAFD